MTPTPEELVKPCTCHPDDDRPVPCQHRYAFNECVQAERDALRLSLEAARGDAARHKSNSDRYLELHIELRAQLDAAHAKLAGAREALERHKVKGHVMGYFHDECPLCVALAALVEGGAK